MQCEVIRVYAITLWREKNGSEIWMYYDAIKTKYKRSCQLQILKSLGMEIITSLLPLQRMAKHVGNPCYVINLKIILITLGNRWPFKRWVHSQTYKERINTLMKVNYLKNILLVYLDLYIEITYTQQSMYQVQFCCRLIWLLYHARKSTEWCQLATII